MWAEGAERRRLLHVFAEQCARAAVLGCTTVMSPVDRGEGSVAQAAASVREVGDLAAAAHVRLAVEFNSQAAQLNALGRIREVMDRAAHPACGLLLDTYHLHRSGATVRDLEDVASSEIAYVQYSDVPAGAAPGQAMPRLAPGLGVVPFREWFRAFAAKGYTGYLSYEAPDPAAWARPPADVARDAIAATRAVCSGGLRAKPPFVAPRLRGAPQPVATGARAPLALAVYSGPGAGADVRSPSGRSSMRRSSWRSTAGTSRRRGSTSPCAPRAAARRRPTRCSRARSRSAWVG